MTTKPATGFYATDAEVYYVTPAGRVWVVASGDGGPEPEAIGGLPEDATEADSLLTPEECIGHCQRVETAGGESLVFTPLFETGEGDAHWSIEERSDGRLVVSSNAETRREITPQGYHGWNAAQFRADLIRDGVSEGLADRVIEQAGL